MPTTIKTKIENIVSTLTTLAANNHPHTSAYALCSAIIQIFNIGNVDWSVIPYASQRALMDATHQLTGLEASEDIIFKIERIFEWMNDEYLNRWHHRYGVGDSVLFEVEELMDRFFAAEEVKRAA